MNAANGWPKAFSTNAYLKYSFAEAVRRVAVIGYTGVEIMADVPHAWPAYLLEEQKQAIRRHLACFFKSPLGVEDHDFFRQFALLEDYVAEARKR